MESTSALAESRVSQPTRRAVDRLAGTDGRRHGLPAAYEIRAARRVWQLASAADHVHSLHLGADNPIFLEARVR